MTSAKIRKPEAILLDFYGTLVEEDERPIVEVLKEIARKAQGGVSLDDLLSEWWSTFSGICLESFGDTFLLERAIERKTFDLVLDKYRVALDKPSVLDNMYDHWRMPPIFPETKEVLAQCDLPVCIVSNIDNDAIQGAMKMHGLVFEHVVTSEDLRSYKPRPELFVKALEILGREPSNVLHVGDSLFSDVRGAKNMGIPVLWIDNRGKKLSPNDPQPDYSSKDLLGLLDILNGAPPRQ